MVVRLSIPKPVRIPRQSRRAFLRAVYVTVTLVVLYVFLALRASLDRQQEMIRGMVPRERIRGVIP